MFSMKTNRHRQGSQRVAQAFRKYAPELHRYIVRRLRREADAADLTQEIFERFIRRGRDEMVDNPQAYLFAIASNVISDKYVREDRSLVVFDSGAVDQLTEELAHSRPDTLAEETDAALDLEYALSKLSPSHRAVLLLIKRDGLSYEEAARRLGLTTATVTMYLFEARAKVKMLLKRRYGR
jgi:RNA polymerase sigma factor (sigma-70 family)